MPKTLQTIPLVKPFQFYDLPTPEAKIGILFFNLGGPDDQASVQPFLQNLFKDNDIIQLPVPQWVQNLFAWRVSRKRKKEAQENYAKIGGGSPILRLTQAQMNLVQAQLTPAFEAKGFSAPKTYLAMRYWHPFLEEALAQIQADGITHLMLMPLYPHYCLATTGSSLREFSQLLSQSKWRPLADSINVATVCSYYKEPRICWQSRVGPLEWLKPYTEDLAEDLAQAGRDNVLMVPISFVSDHIETLFEMDMLYVPVGAKYGLEHWHRAESLNEHPIFVDLLSELCLRLLDAPLLCKVQFPNDLTAPKAPKICATLHSRKIDF